jgi:hypothetical protein
MALWTPRWLRITGGSLGSVLRCIGEASSEGFCRAALRRRRWAEGAKKPRAESRDLSRRFRPSLPGVTHTPFTLGASSRAAARPGSPAPYSH